VRWTLLFFLLLTMPLTAAAELTQREWLEQLTDSLGWNYGLPDDPEENDYIALLSGERDLLLEAEVHHRRSDRVAVKRQTNQGAYSGTGWVSGRRESVTLHLDFLVPHNGRYRLSTATRLPGVKIELADQEFVASAGELLTAEELGAVNLLAGPTSAVISLPADAGIDYLRLQAPPRPTVAPLNGWQPEQPLTPADLALTMLQALELLSVLPPGGEVMSFEAEANAPGPGMKKVADRHLGVPSGGHWVRAGGQPTEWQISVSVPRAGCYQLFLQGAGDAAIRVSAKGTLEQQLRFGPALAERSLGDVCLAAGAVILDFELPQWAGIDKLELTELDTSPDTLTGLLGISADRALENATLNEMLQLLSHLTR